MTAAFFAGALVAATQPPGTLIDRVVAVVDKQVITQSELLTEARLTLVLQQGEAVGSGDLDDQILRRFLDYVVNQTLVAIQVRRLGSIHVSEGEVDRELQRVAASFRSLDAYRAFLRRFDISDEVLRNSLARRLRNERYIAERMRLKVPEGGGDEGARRSRYDDALKRWLVELRASAEIRLLGPTGELELQTREPRVGVK
jgi:hypothetical protein